MTGFARVSRAAVALMFVASACGSAVLRSDGGTAGAGGSSGATGRGGTSGSGAGGTGGTGGSGVGGTGGATGGTGGSGVGGTGGSGAAGTGGGGSTGAAGRGGTGGGGAGGGGAGGTAAGCSPACSATQTCVGTRCLTSDGQPCTLASQCAANACTPFYVDADGDGYGAGTPTGFCGTGTPVGHAAQAGDCCDDSSLPIAKMIHPGAGFQTTSASGACGITWDYDCSGVVETSKSNGTCASNSTFPNNCINVPQNYPETACGTSKMTYGCIAFQTTCTPYPSPDPGTLGCK